MNIRADIYQEKFTDENMILINKTFRHKKADKIFQTNRVSK